MYSSLSLLSYKQLLTDLKVDWFLFCWVFSSKLGIVSFTFPSIHKSSVLEFLVMNFPTLIKVGDG